MVVSDPLKPFLPKSRNIKQKSKVDVWTLFGVEDSVGLRCKLEKRAYLSCVSYPKTKSVPKLVSRKEVTVQRQ